MIPHERSLVKRLEGELFALIGVNTDDDRDMVKSRSKQEQVTWRSFYDGRSGNITGTWKVNGFPTLYVIDHKGMIRHVFLGDPGEKLTQAVDQLLAEMKTKQ